MANWPTCRLEDSVSILSQAIQANGRGGTPGEGFHVVFPSARWSGATCRAGEVVAEEASFTRAQRQQGGEASPDPWKWRSWIFFKIQVMILEVKNPKCQWQNTNLVTMDNWFINLGMYHPGHGMGMPGDADAAYAASGSGGHTFASGYFRWILRDHEVPHQQQAGSDGFWPTFKGESWWHKMTQTRWTQWHRDASIDSRFNMEKFLGELPAHPRFQKGGSFSVFKFSAQKLGGKTSPGRISRCRTVWVSSGYRCGWFRWPVEKQQPKHGKISRWQVFWEDALS